MHWAGGTGEGDETTKVPQWWGIRTRDYAYVEIPGIGERELYDYVSDPYELTNHAAEPAYAAIRADLAAQLASLRAARRSGGVRQTPARLQVPVAETPSVWCGSEHAPFADEAFDFAISQYGAAIWCDPYRWIPEASRVLRPGGRLVFETGSPLVMLCYPDDEDAPADSTLHREYFGMHRYEWHREDGSVDAIEFRLGHGDLIRLLRSCAFEIEELIEIRAPADAPAWPPDIPLEWARRWPSAEAWKVRKVR